MVDTNDTNDAKRMETCIAMLQGPSDEHIFAGLYMITKLDTLSIQQKCEFQRQISQVLGRDFIPRLLDTKGIDENEALRSLAYNILASFTQDPTLAPEYAQERILLHLCADLLKSPVSDMTSDCIAILNNFTRIERGQELLLRKRIITQLFAIVKTISGELDEKKIVGETNEKKMIILNDLWSLLAELSTNKEFWSQMHLETYGFICFEFANKYIKAGNFQILKTIIESTKWLDIWGSIRDCCLLDLRRGLEHALRQKWPQRERDQVWTCVYGLLNHVECDQMFTMDKAHDSKFLILLLKLVAIEIKLSLDEAEESIIKPDHSDAIAVTDLKEREEGIDRILNVLPTCYGIVEVIISWLAKSSSGTELPIPFEELIELQQTLTELSTVVATMLCLIRDFMKSHLYTALELHDNRLTEAVHIITYASIRFYGAWIAESLEDSEELIYKHDMLPFLICYKPNVAKDVNGYLEKLSISAERVTQDSRTLDPLHFLLPGILQITTNAKAAYAIMDNAEVQQRIFAFTCDLCRRIDVDYESVPTLSLCLGILINTLMLNRDRTRTIARYASQWIHALKFIMPMTCAYGTIFTQNKRFCQDLTQYELYLHLACTSLLIGTIFLQHEDAMHHELPSQLDAFIQPFNDSVRNLKAHPPEFTDDSVQDLYEIVKSLSDKFTFKSEHGSNTKESEFS